MATSLSPLLLLALLLAPAAVVVLASPILDTDANEFPLENVDGVPLKKSIVFATGNLDELQKGELPKANVVIGVISSPSHFEQRDAVRSTWAQIQSLTDPKLNALSLENKEQMVVRFIVGQQPDKAVEASLAKESSRFHDIVRVPVTEDWLNLTLKTGEFMKWAVGNFAFDWAFKCDDDSFVLPDRLLNELSKHKPKATYIGKIWTGTPVDRRVDKYTPFSEYSPFAAGAGYALSYDLANYVARNFDTLHKLPMEDVAVGMWLAPLNVKVIDHKNFHSMAEGCDKDMIVQNPAPPQVMRDTFHNAIKGVACHAKPDPFRPEAKNITDHVLLELGIPKESANKASKMDAMAGAQMMVAVGGEESDEEKEDELAEQRYSAAGDGMESDTMNNNQASSTLMYDMNHGAPSASTQNPNEGIMDLEAATDRMNRKPGPVEFDMNAHN